MYVDLRAEKIFLRILGFQANGFRNAIACEAPKDGCYMLSFLRPLREELVALNPKP